MLVILWKIGELYVIIILMAAKRRVLVIDNEPGVLRFMSVSLAAEGFDVVTASNGKDGLKLVDSTKPDIIILDIVMEPLTGYDVLTRLRKFSHCPVIMFTAKSDTGSLALKKGANAFFPKPFRPEQLVKKINDTLNANKPAGD